MTRCGKTHRHILVPVELVNIISKIMCKILLHTMMDKFRFEWPRLFNVIQRINGKNIVTYCKHPCIRIKTYRSHWPLRLFLVQYPKHSIINNIYSPLLSAWEYNIIFDTETVYVMIMYTFESLCVNFHAIVPDSDLFILASAYPYLIIFKC